jgi:hypothetical protein
MICDCPLFSEARLKWTMMRAMKPNDELNEDLTAEWGTRIRWTIQSAKAVELRDAEFREILEKEIPDEVGHARYLTNMRAN